MSKLNHLTPSKTAEILAGVKWTKPQYYAGFSPDGDYLLASQHRDSDSLTRSNWICICQEFETEAFDNRETEYEDRPNVYTWSASHCMVGYVDYLMVRSDAPEETLKAAAMILDKLEQYAVYDEDHWSELENNEACETWSGFSVRDRLEILKGTGVSIFAARRDYMPDDDCGYIAERLRG